MSRIRERPVAWLGHVEAADWEAAISAAAAEFGMLVVVQKVSGALRPGDSRDGDIIGEVVGPKPRDRGGALPAAATSPSATWPR